MIIAMKKIKTQGLKEEALAILHIASLTKELYKAKKYYIDFFGKSEVKELKDNYKGFYKLLRKANAVEIAIMGEYLKQCEEGIKKAFINTMYYVYKFGATYFKEYQEGVTVDDGNYIAAENKYNSIISNSDKAFLSKW